MINIDEKLSEMRSEAVNKYDKESAKELEKAIDRRIMIAAGKVVAITLLVLALVFACISPVMNSIYANPLDCKADDVSVMNMAGYDVNELDISGHLISELKLGAVLNAYYELNYPYVWVGMPPSVKKRGFSKYEISLNMIKDCGRRHIGIDNMQLEMYKGIMSVKSDPEGYSDNMLRFTDLAHTMDTQAEEDSWISLSRDRMADAIKELKELPDSCYIYVSVQDSTPLPIMDLVKMGSEDFQLYWAEVMPTIDTGRTGSPVFTGGISIEAIRGFDAEGNYIDEVTEDILKEHYINNLKLINDNKRIIEGMQFVIDNISGSGEEWIDGAIENAEKMDVLMTEKYCVGGRKADVLKYLSSIDAYSIVVDNVKLSPLISAQD